MEEEKIAQRKYCLQARQELSVQQRTVFSSAICRRLEGLSALQNANMILSYQATEQEVDLSAFHHWASKQGKRIAFPVSYPAGRMEAYLPKDPKSWERGRYGIWTPIPERSERIAPEKLDAVILPCVGFDERGRRLGHGGGYYDRYLPQCPQAVRILAAFEAQRLDRVRADDYDQSAQVIVTEHGAFYPG